MALLVSLAAASGAHAELEEPFATWNQPVPPFTVAGNVHYVGARDIAAFLITSSEGHVLLDGGFAQTAPQILRNVETLGFHAKDVRYVLNSHAHVDHAGGLGALREATGAPLLASSGDAPLLRAGGEEGDPDLLRFEPVAVDRVIEEGATVAIGGTTLTAHVTGGHTPGCTTWTTKVTDAGRTLDVVFLCSVSALPEMDLLRDDALYPGGRAAVFARSFEALEKLPCDLFLAPHASFFAMDEKLEERARGGKGNPFVDPEALRRHLAGKRQAFEELLASQRARKAEAEAAAGPGTDPAVP